MIRIPVLTARLLISLVLISFAPKQAVADNDILRAIVEGGIAVILNETQKNQRSNQVPRDQNKPAVRNQPPAVRTQQPLQTLPLQEMAELQTALRKLGYDPGPVDGKAGRKTGAALSLYLTSRGHDPYNTQLRDAQAMIVAEASAQDSITPLDGVVRPLSEQRNRTVSRDNSKKSVDLPDSIATKNGAALLMTGPAGVAAAYFRSREASNKYALTQSNFTRLFVLKGNPAILEDPDLTIAFVGSLPFDTVKQFLTGFEGLEKMPADFKFRPGNLRWKGSNQFEIEDSRQAFLASHRSTLLTAAADLPSKFMDLRVLELGEYDQATQSLKISYTSIDPWYIQDQSLEFNAELPIRLSRPDVWILPPDQARGIVERYNSLLAQYGSGRGIEAGFVNGFVIAFTYQLEGIRKTDKGVSIDLSAVSIEVYENASLTNKIAELPIPLGSVIASGVKPTEQIVTAETVPLDAIYPHLWAAKYTPNVVDDPAFLKEAFRLRRIIEKRVFDGQKLYDAGRSNAISSGMLGSNSEPSDSDLAAIRAWIIKHAATLTTQTRLSGIRLLDIGSGGSHSVELMKDVQKSLSFNSDPLGPNFSNWASAALDAAQAARPEAMKLQFLPSGDAMPTILALAPHPAWIELTSEQPISELGDLDLEMSRAEVVATTDGQFLLLDITPVSLTFTGPSGNIVKELVIKNAASANMFELAGLKLGMPLDEAVVKASEFIGPGVEPLEELYNDNILSSSVSFRIEVNSVPAKTLNLFYDSTLKSKPLLAVALFDSTKFTDQQQAMAQVLPALEERYGPSGSDYSREDTRYWAVSPKAKAIIKEGIPYDSPCSHSDIEQAASSSKTIGRFGTSNLVQKCGEMISARIFPEGFDILLVNSDAFEGVRSRLAASAPVTTNAPIKF